MLRTHTQDAYPGRMTRTHDQATRHMRRNGDVTLYSVFCYYNGWLHSAALRWVECTLLSALHAGRIFLFRCNPDYQGIAAFDKLSVERGPAGHYMEHGYARDDIPRS